MQCIFHKNFFSRKFSEKNLSTFFSTGSCLYIFFNEKSFHERFIRQILLANLYLKMLFIKQILFFPQGPLIFLHKYFFANSAFLESQILSWVRAMEVNTKQFHVIFHN